MPEQGNNSTQPIPAGKNQTKDRLQLKNAQSQPTLETNISSHMKSILFQHWIQPLPKQEYND